MEPPSASEQAWRDEQQVQLLKKALAEVKTVSAAAILTAGNTDMNTSPMAPSEGTKRVGRLLKQSA